MRSYTLLLVITLILIVGIWLIDDVQPVIPGRMPVPTEFDIKKSKRKDFKNQRKEYIKRAEEVAATPNEIQEIINKQSKLDYISDEDNMINKLNNISLDYYDLNSPLSDNKKEQIFKPFKFNGESSYFLLTELKLN